MKGLFDTNILVDYLVGIKKAEAEFKKYSCPLISIITWMEILVGANNAHETLLLKQFMNKFTILELSSAIAEEAVDLRRLYKIRIPDAIIWASARHEECLFVTRNKRDFPSDDVGIRWPYEL